MKKILFLLSLCIVACSSQQPDNTYDVSVKDSYFKTSHPRVLIDEAHDNIHTATGTYKPFAKLIENDGCIVGRNKDIFTENGLKETDILVVVNAKGDDTGSSAFSAEECKSIANWVNEGGSLLLIADHYPMGGAAQNLSQKFGVTMSNGEASDSIHFHGNAKFKDELTFSRSNGLLMDNVITRGINTVMTFRGQCLTIPENSMVLLKLSAHSIRSEVKGIRKDGGKTYVDFEDYSGNGYCQGLTLRFGKGRVVILGEAAMLTAQTYKDEKFGMNTPGNDNRQLALNIVHWLAGGLE